MKTKKALALLLIAAMSVSVPLHTNVIEAAGKDTSALQVTKKSITLTVGGSKTVSANKAVTWKSSNAKIAKVKKVTKKKAKITAKKKGNCIITVKSGKKQVKIKVKVNAKAKTTNKPTVSPSAYPEITPSINPAVTPSADPTIIPSTDLPITPSADPTIAPSTDLPITPSADPTIAPSTDLPITPSADPTIIPSTDLPIIPSTNPTNIPPEPSVMTAVVSKVEGDSIYIENNAFILQLTENAKIIQIVDGVEKTLAANEVLVGEEITIYYSGSIAEVYPAVLIGCEKVVVKRTTSITIEQATVEPPTAVPVVTVTTTPSTQPIVIPSTTPEGGDPVVTNEPVSEATQMPSIIPCMTPSAPPYITPKTVTRAAIISKVENNLIYIDDGNTYLRLKDAEIVKLVYGEEKEITIEELFPNDKIIITYSGQEQLTYPSVLDSCEKILVESSDKGLVDKFTIGEYDIDYDEQRIFVNHSPYFCKCFPSDIEGETKVLKDGKEISFNDLKAGDTIRVSYTIQGSRPQAPGFVLWFDVIVVLPDHCCTLPDEN